MYLRITQNIGFICIGSDIVLLKMKVYSFCFKKKRANRFSKQKNLAFYSISCVIVPKAFTKQLLLIKQLSMTENVDRSIYFMDKKNYGKRN